MVSDNAVEQKQEVATVLLRPTTVRPDWAERIERARAARELGRRLREASTPKPEVVPVSVYFPVK